MNAIWRTMMVLLVCVTARAHDWHRHEDSQFAHFQSPTPAEAAIVAEGNLALQDGAPALFQPARLTGTAPDSVRVFAEVFARFKPKVRFRWDANFFYVEGDGIPDHNMMVGITAWQRQIPLPTFYFGTNAWRLPLYPVPTNTPYLVTSNTFLRGAIALAANGIPIFNPYNNRGEASALIGELDQWGGHCGRADDYHYHVSPLHLTNVVGITLPVAFALDGYPIYGLVEPDGSPVTGLDALRGHTNVVGTYHYHSSLTLPYLNAGFHGPVAYVNNQVDPQPVVRPVRPSGTALSGATLVGFTNSAPDQFSLRYRLTGNPTDYFWNYTLNRAAKTVSVTYIGTGGTTQTNYPNWEPAPALATTTLGVTRVTPARIRLNLGGHPGRGYELQYSEDFVRWTNADYLLMDGLGATNVVLAPTANRNFFRTR